MQMSLLSYGAIFSGKFVLQLTFFYPEKILQEIDSVIGRSQTPCMADLDKMPYTDAVIHEIHRCLALVPLNVPRAVIKDTSFRQYFIPKVSLAAIYKTCN